MNEKDLFSYEPDVKLSEKYINELPIAPTGKKLKIPKVSLDRKATKATVFGIFSLIFFVFFPFSLSAIILGIKSLKAPSSKKFASAGIAMGIVSLLFLISSVVLFILFYNEIVGSYYFKVITEFFRKLISWS